MAGKGRTPKDHRQNPHDIPTRGDWKAAESIGWQHGETPAPPDGLMDASLTAWVVWFAAWFAAHWTPDDLPGLRTLIRMYDQVERGEFQRAAELRLQMDNYGITPKGQQDRRWAKPKDDVGQPAAKTTDHYKHLRAVND